MNDVLDNEVWLSFYGEEDTPLRVTDESVPAIVALIERHRRKR